MKILIYSHFYFPEVGAASLRMQYFVNTLKLTENEIKIITPLPNYPHGKIYKEFSKFFHRDDERNIIYLPIYLPKKHSVLKRGISYLSYLLSSFLYALFSSFKPDIIITSSPPLSTAFGAAMISKIRRSKFIVDLRDIWPDIGIELGLLKKSFLINQLKRIEQYILKRATSIIVTANGDKENLEKKGISGSKINIIFNGADPAIFKPLSTTEIYKTRAKYNIRQDKIVLIYFGSFNYGMNDIELLGDVLSEMEKYHEIFTLITIGDGDNRNAFLDKIKDKIEIQSFNSLDSKELARLLASSDISLVPRKGIKNDTGGNTPVKCFESWASEVPVLLSANEESEIVNYFEECKAGIFVNPNNVNEYKNALIKMITDVDLKKMGLNGRKYIEENFNRIKQSEKLNSIVNKLISQRHI
jgi:glycosyltransferase involved in cell wall biosynthesis